MRAEPETRVSSGARLLFALLLIGVIAVAARAALPYVLTRYVNTQLAQIGEYTGHVEDIDVALVRGAYTVRDLVIEKRGGAEQTPFAELQTADISLQWGALLSGELVGEISAQGLELNLVQGSTDEDTQLGEGVNWAARIEDFFPFEFNRVEADDCLVTFRAPGIEAEEVLTLSGARLILENLSNVHDEDEAVFTELRFSGAVMSRAALTVTGQIDPNERLPTFDLNFELQETELTDVNPWLEEFLSIDAHAGDFSMYAELAAADGRFEGYVKPILENVEIFEVEEIAENPLREAWEAIVAVVAEVFENQPSDQIATEIPVSGEIENPDAGIIAAIVNLSRNAFVAAFSHSLEGTIDIRDVDPDADVDTG